MKYQEAVKHFCEIRAEMQTRGMVNTRSWRLLYTMPWREFIDMDTDKAIEYLKKKSE